MTKDEAAKYLGVSTRAIERYAKAGKLVVHYKNKPNGGQISLYNDDEVLALKEEQKKKELTKDTNNTPSSAEMSDSNSLVKQSDTLTEPLDKVSHRPLEPIFLEVLERIAKAMEQSNMSSPKQVTQVHVNLSEKLTLTLNEAAALAGLSEYWLTKAIKSGELKAAKRGRGWNVKTADLVTYIGLLA